MAGTKQSVLVFAFFSLQREDPLPLPLLLCLPLPLPLCPAVPFRMRFPQMVAQHRSRWPGRLLKELLHLLQLGGDREGLAQGLIEDEPFS